MKFRYVGGESLPGAGETIVFGLTVKVGGVFECPPEFVAKARGNPAFEPAGDDAPIDPPVARRRGRPPKNSM
jgi:hypothetical protein